MNKTSFENLSSKWIRALTFGFLFIITLIYKFLVLWMKIAGGIQCSACNGYNYTKRGSYSRQWRYSPLGIEYIWNVPRFQCSSCQNSFSSFTNTVFSHHKIPPAIVIFRALILGFLKLGTIKLGFNNNQIAFNLSLTAFLRKAQFLKKIFELRIHLQNPDSMMFFLRNCLNEKQRRLFLGLFALNLPHGGMEQLHQFTGFALKTIRRGKQELQARYSSCDYSSPIRQAGGGKIPKITNPSIESAVLQLIEDETAGDPMTELKWTRRSLRKLSSALAEDRLNLTPSTIAKILRRNNYSPRVNCKSKSFRNSHPDRDQQFQFIAAQKQRFVKDGNPVISIDCKKKEMLGNYKNPGQLWRQEPFQTFDHSFLRLATSQFVPFGIYDLQHNHGFVYCGTNKSTAEFAADAVANWWQRFGSKRYPTATELLIFCDSGGGNHFQSHLWKWFIQQKLADELGLPIQICHYPPGTSKWNPIEHRLFSYISLNWAGRPLIDQETALNYIKTTTTTAGLVVDAFLTEKEYQTGLKVSPDQRDTLEITFDKIKPSWNYQIKPRNENRRSAYDDDFWLLKRKTSVRIEEYTCQSCLKEFRNKPSTTIEQHTWGCGKDRFCDTCGRNFKNKILSTFEMHLWSCGKDRICPECGKNYRNKKRQTYNNHVWGCNVDRFCEICNKNYRNKTKRMFAIHTKKCQTQKS